MRMFIDHVSLVFPLLGTALAGPGTAGDKEMGKGTSVQTPKPQYAGRTRAWTLSRVAKRNRDEAAHGVATMVQEAQTAARAR